MLHDFHTSIQCLCCRLLVYLNVLITFSVNFVEAEKQFLFLIPFFCSERDNLDRRIVELEKACTVYKTELEARSNQMEAVRSQVRHSKLLFQRLQKFLLLKL